MAVEHEEHKERKGVVVPLSERAPHNPNNIHMKKSDFVEAERIRKEKLAKIKAYADSLEEEKTPEIQKAPAAPIAKKKQGRPKGQKPGERV